MDREDLPDDTHDHVVEQLLGKDWGELEVLEHADYLLFPDTLYRRRSNGTFEEIPIMLRLPREHEFRKARIQARRLCADEGLDLKEDADLVENLENLCLLSMAIRNRTEPHEPWEPDPQRLERTYDRASLMQVWAKLDKLNEVVNPAPEKISQAEMVALMAALSKERHLAPLVVYGSGAQTHFVLTMVDLLLNLLESKSWSELSALSTRES